MRTGYLAFLRRIALVVLVIASGVSLAAVFASRLPNQEVCLSLFRYSGSASTTGYTLYDTTNWRWVPETRFQTNLSLNSPNNQNWINFRPIATEQYDIYAEYPTKRLLQQGVWINSSGFDSVTDRTRWSRDSSKIAFAWTNGPKDTDVHLTLASVADGQIKTVTAFKNDTTKIFYAYVQEWSADNRYFSMIEQNVNDMHYSFWDANTLTAVDYPLSASAMVRGTWAPQGHSFAAIVRNDHLKPTHLMILNPEKSDTLIQVPLPPVNVQHLMWSPDGKTLVIGYLSCDTANCHQQWHYALFRADGTPLAMDLVGSVINSTNLGGDTVYGPDGRTKMSGYPFNATWSSDGKRFVYLGEGKTGDNPTDTVHTYNLDQKVETEVVYPAVNFNNSFFHTVTQYATLSSRILEPIPTLPLSDQIIIPYMDDGKITVELTGSKLQKPIVLVKGAEQLLSLPNTQMQGQFWGTDWYSTDHILIEWSSEKGPNKDIQLTTTDANGDHLQTIDTQLNDISKMRFVYDKERPILGYIGKIGEQNNLYMLDLNTGKQTLLLENVEDNSDWEMNFNKQQTLMVLRANIIQTIGGQLYIYSVENDTLTKIDANPHSTTIWSDDGEKIALISSLNNGAQDLVVFGKDGQPLKSFEVSPNSVQNYVPVQWSKCD